MDTIQTFDGAAHDWGNGVCVVLKDGKRGGGW